MNIDNKLPQFKSFMSENKLGKGGVKTTIDQSAVTAGENANVDLDLSTDEESKEGLNRFKRKKKKAQEKVAAKVEVVAVKKSDAEVKVTNMKLLNLL